MTDDPQVAAFKRMMDRNMAALNEYTAPLHERIRELESAAAGMLNAWVMFKSGMPGAKDEIVTALEGLRLALTQDYLDEEACNAVPPP